MSLVFDHLRHSQHSNILNELLRAIRAQQQLCPKQSILRRQPLEGFDLSFLFTNEHLKKHTKTDLVQKFVGVGVSTPFFLRNWVCYSGDQVSRAGVTSCWDSDVPIPLSSSRVLHHLHLAMPLGSWRDGRRIPKEDKESKSWGWVERTTSGFIMLDWVWDHIMIEIWNASRSLDLRLRTDSIRPDTLPNAS